jgi:hypothetical protein
VLGEGLLLLVETGAVVVGAEAHRADARRDQLD